VTVWCDADSLPVPVRDLICRRVGLELEREPGLALRAVFVANKPIPLRAGRGVSSVRVDKKEGSADEYMEARAAAGDMVVTRDIPLAQRLLDAGKGLIRVLNDRGGVFDPETIRERRSVRDAMRELALSGLVDRPGPSYGPKEARAFSGAFDRELSRLIKTMRGKDDEKGL
jgi:uncharacterized protein YaiI (UPF0178 family)